MNIPTLLRQPWVNIKTGELTPAIQNHQDQLHSELLDGVSNNGFVIPPMNTSGINYILNNSTPNNKPDGTLLYDNEAHALKVKINGVVKTITVT